MGTRAAENACSEAKFFGDVLKNVMPKFSSDVEEVPIFFEGVETGDSAQCQDDAGRRQQPGDNTAAENGRRAEMETVRSARAAIGYASTIDSSQTETQNFAKLTYVPICIQGVTGSHNALHDSGSQINLIKRDLLQQLPEIQTTGRISIKGIVGPAIETDLALLDIRPAPAEVGCMNIAPPLREIFAVCDELNHAIILTSDTVKRLSALNEYDTLIAVNQTTVTDRSKMRVLETVLRMLIR